MKGLERKLGFEYKKEEKSLSEQETWDSVINYGPYIGFFFFFC